MGLRVAGTGLSKVTGSGPRTSGSGFGVKGWASYLPNYTCRGCQVARGSASTYPDCKEKHAPGSIQAVFSVIVIVV